MKTYKKALKLSAIAVVSLLGIVSAQAQITVSALDSAVVTDFTGLNGFATFGSAVMPAGSFAGRSASASSWNPVTSSANTTGEYGFASTGAVTAGSLVRGFKDESGGGVAGLGEYEIGSTASDGIAIEVGSGSFVDGAFYLRFRNNTGSTVDSWKINYDGLFSNLTDGSATATFTYSSDNWGSTLTNANLSFTSGGALTAAAWVDAGITEQTITASVANGSDLIIGWAITGTLDGSFNSDVIAFDNISVTATAVPEPSTYALIFGGIVLGFAVYRRRKQAKE